MPDGAKTGPNDFDNIGKFFFYFIFGSIALVYFVVGIEHSFYSAAYLLLMDDGKEKIFELLISISQIFCAAVLTMNLIMIYKKKLILGDKIFNIINIMAIIFACSETFYYSYFEIRYIIPYAAFVLMFQVIWFVAPYYYMRKNIDWFRSG